jgi:hypothetical protein
VSFLLLLSGLLAGLVAARRQIRRAERLRREWSAYAARRGLRYTLGNEGLSLEPVHRLDGRRRSTPVRVRTGFGILHSMTTTVTGKAPLPLDGRVYVYLDPVFSQAADAVDLTRVHVEDRAFDGGTFVVEATCESVVRTVLGSTVRRALLDMSQCGRRSLNFRCAGDDIIVEWLGDEALPELFDQACELVALAGESRRVGGAYR